jgi:hypothetical protein
VATPLLGWSFRRTARANLRRLAALLEGAYGRRASATSRAA